MRNELERGGKPAELTSAYAVNNFATGESEPVYVCARREDRPERKPKPKPVPLPVPGQLEMFR